MTSGRPNAELMLTDDERARLASFARSRSLPASVSSRAHIVLSSAAGEANSSIAERLKLIKATVGKWRTRCLERRVAGLYDDMRPGPPRSIDDERVASLIKTSLHTKPSDVSTHWSVRAAAAETGISKSSVQRYFQLFGLARCSHCRASWACATRSRSPCWATPSTWHTLSALGWSTGWCRRPSSKRRRNSSRSVWLQDPPGQWGTCAAFCDAPSNRAKPGSSTPSKRPSQHAPNRPISPRGSGVLRQAACTFPSCLTYLVWTRNRPPPVPVLMRSASMHGFAPMFPVSMAR